MIAEEWMQMARLVSQPGTRMHAEWWPMLGLEAWQAPYRTYRSCRPSIDALIAQRLGWRAQALPSELTPSELTLLALSSRLPQLVTAMGVWGLGRKEAVLLGEYRRVLEPVLGDRCHQLLALWPSWAMPVGDAPQPGAMVEQALRCGSAWLQRDLEGPAWQAAALLLPPVTAESAVPAPAWPALDRLSRFL